MSQFALVSYALTVEICEDKVFEKIPILTKQHVSYLFFYLAFWYVALYISDVVMNCFGGLMNCMCFL